MSRRRDRRFGAALVTAGLLSGLASLATFQAGPAAATELFSFELKGGARGFQYFNAAATDADLADPGAGVGETRAELASGPIGYGLAAVAWPGALISNAGTLLLLLQPTTPREVADRLNFPLRAEARSGQNPPETTFNDVPGTQLKSTATNEKVTADATIASVGGLPGTIGSTNAHSEVRNSSDGGVVETNSEVQDIDLGAVTIKSVTSTASAKTDGSKGDGQASTSVIGLEIGGQPATVDENGLTIGEVGEPVNAVANQIAQQALASGGFDIRVTAPVKEIDGASVRVTAGSLIITQKEGLGALVFGGASAFATGAPGDPSLVTDPSVDPVDVGAVDIGTGSLDLGSLPLGVGTLDISPVPAPAIGPPEVALAPTRSAASGGKPTTAGTVTLGLLAVGFLAFGMRRLSDSVFLERASIITCSLEGRGR